MDVNSMNVGGISDVQTVNGKGTVPACGQCPVIVTRHQRGVYEIIYRRVHVIELSLKLVRGAFPRELGSHCKDSWYRYISQYINMDVDNVQQHGSTNKVIMKILPKYASLFLRWIQLWQKWVSN